MSTNTILWVQSPNHLDKDYLYVDGVFIDNDNPRRSDYVNEVLSIDHSREIYEESPLSIYQYGKNCYHISSIFLNEDDSGRRLAFIAKIKSESINDIASCLDELIKSCGYSIEGGQISTIDETLKKKLKEKTFMTKSIPALLTIIVVIVALILIFQKCSPK